MGSTASFAVLASSTITNEGSSVLAGSLGLFAGSAVSGFPPGEYSGEVYIQDCVALEAQVDLTAAKMNAGSRALTYPILADAEDLGGQTLLPGVYASLSSLYVTSGDLTLDGNDEIDPVWIFQIGSTFIVADYMEIKMINTNAASDPSVVNVWWNVGSSATYSLDCVVIGVTMANISITVETGATTGAVFAANGAVTLSSNTITSYNSLTQVGPGCPTASPTIQPTSSSPSISPSRLPTVKPTKAPITTSPTALPTPLPGSPTIAPFFAPTSIPSFAPTKAEIYIFSTVQVRCLLFYFVLLFCIVLFMISFHL